MMRQQLAAGVLLLAAATLTAAQHYGPPSDSDGDDYDYDSDSDFSGGNPFSDSDDESSFGGQNGAGGFQDQIFTRYNGIIAAHAVLATLAFALVFPAGGILIRIGSFPGLWLVHGIVQLVASFMYVAAFALGIYMVTHGRDLLYNAHPIIGIALLALLVFQPVLGYVHHVAFKKYSRRTVWSYAHLWIGRVVVTLGIVNGGLGLQLSQRTRIFAPSQGAVIGYGVAAGLIWLAYVASAIYGERKRGRQAAANAEVAPPPKYTREKRGSDSETERPTRYA